MRYLIAALGVAAALSVAQTANAEEQWCRPGTAMDANGAQIMLEKLGYKVKRMDREHGCIEAKGFDANGNRVEVYVDPNDGRIVQVKR